MRHVYTRVHACVHACTRVNKRVASAGGWRWLLQQGRKGARPSAVCHLPLRYRISVVMTTVCSGSSGGSSPVPPVTPCHPLPADDAHMHAGASRAGDARALQLLHAIAFPRISRARAGVYP